MNEAKRELPSREELERLTKDVIEDYTEQEIEALIRIQKRFDNWSYTPIDSKGGMLPDDGSDPYFYYQSNLVPILELLASKFRRELDEDETEGVAPGQSLDGLRNAQFQDLEHMRNAAFNNSRVNEEKSRAKLLSNLATELELSLDTNAIFQHMGENPSLLHIDENVPVEGLGSLEEQVSMMSAMLRYRRDQSNSCKRIIEVLHAGLLRQQEAIRTNNAQLVQEVAAAAQLQQEAVISSLTKEVADLKREQEYLYWRLYGPAWKYDPKADRQKKYRKEVDDTYKQMVEAEVAKRVLKAVKNSDAYVRKIREELDETHKMMQKCHKKTMNVILPARRLAKTNRKLEQQLLELEDLQHGNETFLATQKAIEDQKRALQEPTLASLREAVNDLQRVTTASLDSLALNITAPSGLSGPLYRTICSATSEAAVLLADGIRGTLSNTFSSASYLPPRIRATVSSKVLSQLVSRFTDRIPQLLQSFLKNILDGKDTNYLSQSLQPLLNSSSAAFNDATVQTDSVLFSYHDDDDDDKAEAFRDDPPKKRNADPGRRGSIQSVDSSVAETRRIVRRSQSFSDSEISDDEEEIETQSSSTATTTTTNTTATGRSVSKVPKKGPSTPSKKPNLVLDDSIAVKTKSSRSVKSESSTVSGGGSDSLTRKPSKRLITGGSGTEKRSPHESHSPTKGSSRQLSTENSKKTVSRKEKPSETTANSDAESEPTEEPGMKKPRSKKSRDSVTFHDTPTLLAKPQGDSEGLQRMESFIQFASRKCQTDPPPSRSDVGVQVFERSSSQNNARRETTVIGRQNRLGSVAQSGPEPLRDTGKPIPLGLGPKPNDAAAGPNPAVQYPSGNCCFVFLGIDSVTSFWQRCPDVMPNTLAAYNQILRDGLLRFDGYEARQQADAMMCVFRNVFQAASFALWIQHHILKLPYPQSILAVSRGVHVIAGDGQTLWRGFRVRIGIHLGEALCTISNGKARYSGSTVTFASRMAVFACGGQIIVSSAAAEALRPQLEELNLTLRPQGDCKGEVGSEPIYDLVDQLLSMRPFQYDLNDSAANAGTLYQWQCTYAAESDFDIHNSVVFCFVEIQSEVDFIDEEPEVINGGTLLIAAECRRLSTRYQGKEARCRGPSLLFVFAAPLRAAQFALSIQTRIMNLPFSDRLREVDGLGPRLEGGTLLWNGLRVRCALHYGRPTSTAINRITNQVDYFGPEVSRGALLAASARFGETILSTEFFKEIRESCMTLEPEPAIFMLDEKRESAVVYAMHPKPLMSRHEELQATFFRPLFETKSDGKKNGTPSEPSSPLNAQLVPLDSEFVAGDITYVCSWTVARAAEAIERCQKDFEAAMNALIDLARKLASEHGGFLCQLEGVNAQVLFSTAGAAAIFATELQRALLSAAFPQTITDFFETVTEGGNLIFKGIRLQTALNCGQLHEFHTGLLNDRKKSFYGTALNQCSFLSGNFSCGGEIVLTDAFQKALLEDEEGQRMIAGGAAVIYRLEGIALPGDLNRTPLYGLCTEELLPRRKKFFRGQNPGLSNALPIGGLQIGSQSLNRGDATGSTSPLSSALSPSLLSPAAIKMRTAKFMFDSQGWSVSNVIDIGNDVNLPTGLEPDAHRINSMQLQKLYRLVWQAAGKCGKVMGYPADIDEDPFAFDAQLREAIAAEYKDAEIALFSAETTVLQRLQEMVQEMIVALGVQREKGVYKHHSQQSVIFIPPDDKDDALYKKHDLGQGKRVTVGKADAVLQQDAGAKENVSSAAPAFSGYRAGISSSLVASRLQEQRIMALERELNELKAKGNLANEIDQIKQAPSDRSLMMSNLNVSSEVTLLNPPEQQHLEKGRPKSRALSERDASRSAQAKTPALLWRKGLPLAPLQTPYVPDPELKHIRMVGETTSNVSLSAPFSSNVNLRNRPLSQLDARPRTTTPGMTSMRRPMQKAGLSRANAIEVPLDDREFPKPTGSSIDFVD
jgi:class 3 adenylate cyclase